MNLLNNFFLSLVLFILVSPAIEAVKGKSRGKKNQQTRRIRKGPLPLQSSKLPVEVVKSNEEEATDGTESRAAMDPRIAGVVDMLEEEIDEVKDGAIEFLDETPEDTKIIEAVEAIFPNDNLGDNLGDNLDDNKNTEYNLDFDKQEKIADAEEVYIETCDIYSNNNDTESLNESSENSVYGVSDAKEVDTDFGNLESDLKIGNISFAEEFLIDGNSSKVEGFVPERSYTESYIKANDNNSNSDTEYSSDEEFYECNNDWDDAVESDNKPTEKNSNLADDNSSNVEDSVVYDQEETARTYAEVSNRDTESLNESPDNNVYDVSDAKEADADFETNLESDLKSDVEEENAGLGNLFDDNSDKIGLKDKKYSKSSVVLGTTTIGALSVFSIYKWPDALGKFIKASTIKTKRAARNTRKSLKDKLKLYSTKAKLKAAGGLTLGALIAYVSCKQLKNYYAKPK